MNSRSSKLLFDVLESCRSIRDWCAGRCFADYEKDRQFRRAVEREFEIIGEALNRLSIHNPDVATKITELPRIVGFRNRIIHGYDTVDDAMGWGVIEAHCRCCLRKWSELLAALKSDDVGTITFAAWAEAKSTALTKPTTSLE